MVFIFERDRFQRLELILKEEGLERLMNSSVMVLGLGGVGSNCCEALARGGIGNLSIIDMDIVEASNINRQALAFTSTIGRPKSQVMEEMIKEINPSCRVESLNIELRADNLNETLGSFPRPDYVIDCIDSVVTKGAIGAWAQENGFNIIAAMGAANKLDPLLLEFDDIMNTTYCPLSRTMRGIYKKFGVKEMEVIFSREEPMKIANPKSSAKGHTLGTMSYMPPIMGQMLAGRVICRLAQV